MNITYQNYPEFKNSINFGKMPKAFTEIVPNINKLDSYYKLYSKSDKIAQAFDKFLKVYNDVATETPIDKKKKPENPLKPEVKKGGKIEYKTPKAKISEKLLRKSIDKEKKPEKAEKTKIRTKRTVHIMPTEIALLIRVKNLIGKMKQAKDFANVHKAIQRANAERTITKESKFAEILNQSLNWIESCYNYLVKNEKPSEQFEMKDKELQSKILEAATGTTISEAVKILKKYIRLEAKNASIDDAARLLKRIKKFKEDNTNTEYTNSLNKIEDELKQYINYNKGALRIPPTTLNGIIENLGCNCTLSGLGYINRFDDTDFFLPNRINNNTRGLGDIIITPKDDYTTFIDDDENNGEPNTNQPDYTGGKPLSNIKPNTNTFILPGDIGKFLGPIALDRYSVIIKSPRGGGKSRLSLMLANAFLSRFNRVDYFSLEMSASNPQIRKEYFQKYISPENAGKLIVHDEGTIEKVRRVAQQSRVVIIDSWGKLGSRAEEYGKLRESYPGTAFIVIFQNVGDGTVRGGVGSEYDCDELIVIYPGSTFRETYAQKDKSRYTDTERQFNLFNQKLI